MSTQTVSVILAYFNREDTVVEAAQSVLDQSSSDLRLYLVDDGSTDRSAARLGEVADSRIVHLRSAGPSGPSVARNVGLDHVTTDLVAFMDSDDVWLPSKLEVQMQALRDAQQSTPTVGVVGCGWRNYDGTPAGSTFLEGPFRRLDVMRGRVNGIGTPMLLVDRAVVAKGARFDDKLPALVDRDFVMACLANGSQVVVVPEVLALVRRGRSDHVANSHRAAAAYERMLVKYSADLDDSASLRSWYHYRAAREHLAHGGFRAALRHVPPGLHEHRIKRSVHLACGALGRRKGLAAAQRLAPLPSSI